MKRVGIYLANFLIGLVILYILGYSFFFVAAFISAILDPAFRSEAFDVLLIIVSFVSAISCTVKIAMWLYKKQENYPPDNSELPMDDPFQKQEKRLRIYFKDDLFPDCVEIILESGLATAGRFQKSLKIGSIRAENLLKELEEQGIIGPSNGNHPREIFVDWDQWKNAEKIYTPQTTETVKRPIRCCVHCGIEIDPNANFCPDCGHGTASGNKPSSNAHSKRIPYYARNCSRCRSQNISHETVVESNKAGCMTYLIYFVLALTIFGLLIVIPLLLRSKTKTVTYAVCQNCGHRWRVY